MTPKDFFDKVVEMRTAQKEYFRRFKQVEAIRSRNRPRN